jgi:glycosyltransferase involved in cell wall biosynthesis
MIRVLRPAASAGLISARVFDDSFAQNLFPEVSIEHADLADWLNSIFGCEELRPDRRSVQEAFLNATRDFQFLCPNYLAIPLAPLLLYLRNRSRSRIRLLLIAHAPGAYALEWALLRPLLRSGDLIVSPTASARNVIDFLCPELTPYTRVVPHPMRPLPHIRCGRRQSIVSLTRMHSSKLLHRQIEAMAILRGRGIRSIRMQVAAPLEDAGARDMCSYARSLAAKICRLGLSDCVELTGPVEGAESKAIFLSQARLLVNLSITIEESFGKSIVEAMSSGVAVLATRWNGFPETAGSAGTCVPADVTPLGLDVPAERIADAMELLLESPPESKACRREALRFHPQCVRRLYRQELEAAIDTSAALSEAPDQPAAGYSAAPSRGLLSVTAPLGGFSWNELFQFHVQGAARLRKSFSGVADRIASEAEELRSLLILGVRAPLSRFLAGVDPGEMSCAAGRPREQRAVSLDFVDRVSEVAMSRATIASRLTCLSLTANRGRVEQLRAGLAAMRADGLQSWGTRFLEIEALRQEGYWQHAIEMSIKEEEPVFWGELAAARLRQLAALCREGRLPGMALPWLREWLNRFPDSPDSGMVWFDRCVNALGAGLIEEARKAFESARLLLSASPGLTGVEALLQGAEADSEPLQMAHP